MIIYYYGGTSPTNRALGIQLLHAYVCRPGICSLYAQSQRNNRIRQEFAARHVNAWENRLPMKLSAAQNCFVKNIPL